MNCHSELFIMKYVNYIPISCTSRLVNILHLFLIFRNHVYQNMVQMIWILQNPIGFSLDGELGHLTN